MASSIKGLLLTDLIKSNSFYQAFQEITEKADRFPLLIKLSDEENGELALDKLVFDSLTKSFSRVRHPYCENSIHAILFEEMRYFGSGYSIYSNHMILDSLSPYFVEANNIDANGIYSDCNLLRSNTKMDAIASNYLDSLPDQFLDPRRSYILPFGRLCHNFAHWHLNCLTSIYLGRKYFPEALFITPPLSGWQKDSLDLFGLYDEEAFISVHPALAGGCVVPNAIFFSTSFAWKGLNHANLLASIFSSLATSMSQLSRQDYAIEDSPKKIYLSRRSETNHKLFNESEVEDEFRHHGFTILEPQKVPYKQMAYMIANANYLAGPNGAALIRGAMCNHEASIIQLCFEGSPDYWLHKHYSFSGVHKSYVYLEGKDSVIRNNSYDPSVFWDMEGWTINLDSLRCFLREVV